jgi:hypothetical protein
MDRASLRATLFLLVAPGFLAEVLSENTPLLTALHPATFILMVLSYGVPVLLIREFAVARRLNPIGIILVGIGYGMLNEGVLAKTLTLPAGLPIAEFAGYGKLGTVQSGWAIFILFWHALHSVLYPILLGDWLFPAAAGRRWFITRGARRLVYLMVLIVLVLYSLYFLVKQRSDIGTFALYVSLTLALAGIAVSWCTTRGRTRSPPQPSYAPAFIGATAILFNIFQFWSPSHIPFATFLALTAATIAFAAAAMRRAGWRPVPELLLFGLGDYLTFALLSSLLSFTGNRHAAEGLAAGAIFLVLFLYLIRAVRKQPLGRSMNGREPILGNR